MLKQKNKKIILGFAIALFLVFSFPLNTFASEITRDGVVNLLNKERTERGLNILSVNSHLQTAAQWKADDMIEKDYWEHFHNGKSPWQWMKEAGYNYLDAGENLAIDFTELEPMMTAWMNSPTHRDNIINAQYKEVGIGVASGDFEGHQTIIVVQMFGNPVPQPTASKATNQPQVAPAQNSIENQFEAKADENNTVKDVQTVKKEEVKANFWQKGIAMVNNLAQRIVSNYKSNFSRNLVYLRSIIVQNYSASANY